MLCATLLSVGCDAYDEKLLDGTRASDSARRPGRSPFLTLDAAGIGDPSPEPDATSDAAPPANPIATDSDAGVRGVLDAAASDGAVGPDLGVPDGGGTVGDAGGGGIVTPEPEPEPEPEPQPDDDAGPPPEPEVPCGDLGGTEAPDGHCYFAVSMLQTWFVGRDRCIQLGGDLASITSVQEQEFVAPLVAGSPHWIGLARFGSRFTWHSGELFAFSNFATGEPNGMGEVGVVLGNLSGTWFDTDVRDTFPALCERE